MLLALLLLLAQEHATRPVPVHSVIVYVLDDVGALDLELASSSGLTPTIDALAARGVRYTNAYANGVCSPSRTSLVTGFWSAGDRGLVCSDVGGDPLSPSLQTIAELAPYPDALAGKWHVGRNPVGPWQLAPEVAGFGHWLAGTPTNVNGCENGVHYSKWVRVDDGVDLLSHAYEPTTVSDSAIGWWDSIPATRPRLLVYCPQLAHGPFHAPPPALLPAGYVVGGTDPEMHQAMIGAADTLLGVLLAHADLDDLVIVVGDNGTPEQVAPNPLIAKTTTFERGVRVPLIVAGHGFAHGAQDGGLRHMADLLPTVASFWHVQAPACDGLPLQGASHETIVCTGTDDRAAVGFGLKLRRTATTEELFELPDEVTNHVGDPVDAMGETALRAILDEFDAR